MLVLDGEETSSLLSQCSPESVAADIDQRSRVIDVLTGEVLLDLGDRGLVGNALFNPPGVFEEDRYLAVNVSFYQVEIHDMVTGEMVAEISFEEEARYRCPYHSTPRGNTSLLEGRTAMPGWWMSRRWWRALRSRRPWSCTRRWAAAGWDRSPSDRTGFSPRRPTTRTYGYGTSTAARCSTNWPGRPTSLVRWRSVRMANFSMSTAAWNRATWCGHSSSTQIG